MHITNTQIIRHSVSPYKESLEDIDFFLPLLLFADFADITDFAYYYYNIFTWNS